MPEFYASYTPDNIARYIRKTDHAFLPETLTAYLECAEWTDWNIDNQEAEYNKPVRGWSHAAIKSAAEDCRDFLRANDADCTAFLEVVSPHDSTAYEKIGHDLWLTRNHHGAGFWDRGAGAVGQRLTNAARLGERNVYRSRAGLLHFG